MPSGKKARGRKNRAKKETAARRALWEQTILRNSGGASNNATASSCEHMLAVLPRIPQEGPAVSFMNFLAGEGCFSAAQFSSVNPVDFGLQATMRFPGVREEESVRSLTIDLLLRFIRNVFVHDSAIEESWFQQYRRNEVAICCMINTLELCGTYSDKLVAERRAYRTANRLANGNRRDTVKFVVKRLPCACLKKLHSAVRKKVAKVGTCFGCKKQFPRSQLHVCTGCMIHEYCSRECQRATWPNHKQYCSHPEVMSRDLPADFVWYAQSSGDDDFDDNSLWCFSSPVLDALASGDFDDFGDFDDSSSGEFDLTNY